MATGDIKGTLSGLPRIHTMEVSRDSHHYISLSLLHAWLEREALPHAKGVLLDYGCGGQPYKRFFRDHITKYIGADVAAAEGTTLDIEISPNQHLPLPDESVDTILSTQTLEHIRNVGFYLKECARLLKPDGILILTAPMQWRHHEVPYDFLRFTRYGLMDLLENNGFVTKSMTACGGVYALIGQIFLNHLSERGVQRKLLYSIINRLSLWLDKKYPDDDETLNWMCIAERKDTTSQGRIRERR